MARLNTEKVTPPKQHRFAKMIQSARKSISSAGSPTVSPAGSGKKLQKGFEKVGILPHERASMDTAKSPLSADSSDFTNVNMQKNGGGDIKAKEGSTLGSSITTDESKRDATGDTEIEMQATEVSPSSAATPEKGENTLPKILDDAPYDHPGFTLREGLESDDTTDLHTEDSASSAQEDMFFSADRENTSSMATLQADASMEPNIPTAGVMADETTMEEIREELSLNLKGLSDSLDMEGEIDDLRQLQKPNTSLGVQLSGSSDDQGSDALPGNTIRSIGGVTGRRIFQYVLIVHLVGCSWSGPHKLFSFLWELAFVAVLVQIFRQTMEWELEGFDHVADMILEVLLAGAFQCGKTFGPAFKRLVEAFNEGLEEAEKTEK